MALNAIGKERFVASIPLIPGFNSSKEEMESIASHLEKTGVVLARVLPYHRLGSGKYARLGRKYSGPESALDPGVAEDMLSTLLQHHVNAWIE